MKKINKNSKNSKANKRRKNQVKNRILIFMILLTLAAASYGIIAYRNYTDTHYTVTVYLMRHGETEGNVNGVVNGGGSDSALTENGLKQLEKAGRKLRNVHFDAAYSSPLGRAQKSARRVLSYNKSWHGDIQTVEGLADIYWGDIEGKPVAEIVNKYGQSAFYTGEYTDKNFKSQVSAESTYDFLRRFQNAMNGIVTSHAVHNKTILVVTHSSATYWIRSVTGDKNIRMLKNAEIVKLTYKNGKYLGEKRRYYNEVQGLADELERAYSEKREKSLCSKICKYFQEWECEKSVIMQ